MGFVLYAQEKQSSYKCVKFIGYDDVFNKEYLYKPSLIRKNPISNEVIIMDSGNRCLYFFTEEGKYIRKIGGKGQGPREFLGLHYLDINNNGDIYTYDINNQRLTIFSKDGFYLSSFKYIGSEETHFTVSQEEILFNTNRAVFPRNYSGVVKIDACIFVYDKNGELIRDIGKPKDYGGMGSNNFYGVGIPFKDKEQNYYIFLYRVGIARKFNNLGKLIKESELETIETIRMIRKHKDYNISAWMFFDDVFFDGTYFYLLTDNGVYDNNTKTAYLYRIDKEFNIVNKEVLNSYVELGATPMVGRRPSFVILNSGNILMTIYTPPQVVKFIK